MGSTERREQCVMPCATLQVLRPPCLVSPLSPAPTGLVDLCYIPEGCGDKATVNVSNAMKIHSNKELCIHPNPQSTP